MEGRKESKYNLSGTCPECGKLIKVEHIIAVDLVEQGTSKETEGKPDASKGETNGTGSSAAEGDGVRPADEAGKPGSTDSAGKPADSAKSGRAKKTGGK